MFELNIKLNRLLPNKWFLWQNRRKQFNFLDRIGSGNLPRLADPIRSDPGICKLDLDPIQIREIRIQIRILDRGSALQYITENSYLTHRHNQGYGCIGTLLPLPPGYVTLIWSKKNETQHKSKSVMQYRPASKVLTIHSILQCHISLILTTLEN